MNLFTNAATVIFWFFNRYCNIHYRGRQDTATKEVLTEKNKKFELQKMFQLPWMFWAVMAFSLFQTTTASVFGQNATELAEKRFNVDSITAGWYSSLSQYAGFFLVPCLGVFIDVLGNRASVCKFPQVNHVFSLSDICQYPSAVSECSSVWFWLTSPKPSLERPLRLEYMPLLCRLAQLRLLTAFAQHYGINPSLALLMPSKLQ